MQEGVYGSAHDVYVELEMTRVIFKCGNKACKHVWAYEYRKVYSRLASVWYPLRGLPICTPADYCLLRYASGMIDSHYDNDCPKCLRKCSGKAREVEGTYNEAKRCNARCKGAISGSCECSCGGKNHGIAHM